MKAKANPENKKIVSLYLNKQSYEILNSYCQVANKSKSEVVSELITKFTKKYAKLNEDYKKLAKENNIVINLD